MPTQAPAAGGPTHYDVLRVPRDADAATLKRAYRAAAKRAHPDVGGSHQEMAVVGTAYQVLSNALLRREYDEQTFSGDPTPGPGAARPDPQPATAAADAGQPAQDVGFPAADQTSAPTSAPTSARWRRHAAGGHRTRPGRRPRRRPAASRRPTDSMLDQLGVGHFLRTAAGVAAAAAAGLALRMTGLPGALWGVQDGQMTSLGTYRAFPDLPVQGAAAWALVAVLAVGVVVAATTSWQRRTAAWQLTRAEHWAAALTLTAATATGELVLTNGAAAATFAAAGAAWLLAVGMRRAWARRRRTRPTPRQHRWAASAW